MRYREGVDPRADGRMRRGGRRKLGKATTVMRVESAGLAAPKLHASPWGAVQAALKRRGIGMASGPQSPE
jgi:hypothetical protein